MRDGEEWNPVKVDRLHPRIGIEHHIEEQVRALMGSQTHHYATHETTDCSGTIHRPWAQLLSS